MSIANENAVPDKTGQLNELNLVLPPNTNPDGRTVSHENGVGGIKAAEYMNMNVDLTQSMNEPIGQPVNQTVTQSNDQPPNQPVGQTINPPINSGDMPNTINYIIEQQQQGSLRLHPPPTDDSVGLRGREDPRVEHMLNHTHIEPHFSIPTDNAVNHGRTVQSTPSMSTGGSTNFQVQLAQRLADIDQRMLRLELLLENLCNKVDTQVHEHSLWKNERRENDNKFAEQLAGLKNDVLSIRGHTEGGAFAAELLNAITCISSRYLGANNQGSPSSTMNENPSLKSLASSNVAPISYVPGEHVNLNQMGNSKDHIDNFLTKSATEFTLNPNAMKKRRRVPSNEEYVNQSHSAKSTANINYSSSLPNLNLDVLSKSLLLKHPIPHGQAHQAPLQHSHKGIKFGISSTSQSSDSSDDEDDVNDAEEGFEEDEADDEIDLERENRNKVSGIKLNNNPASPRNTTNNKSMGSRTRDDVASSSKPLKVKNKEKSYGPQIVPSKDGGAVGIERIKLTNSQREPKYTMIKAPSSVREIWEEYTKGIDGRPSIKSLDQTFGNKWRANKNKKTYSRRKRMYKFILNGLKKGKTEKEMIELLENQRIYKDEHGNQKKKTIGWLQQSLSGI